MKRRTHHAALWRWRAVAIAATAVLALLIARSRRASPVPDPPLPAAASTAGAADLFAAFVAEGDSVEKFTDTVEKVIDGDTVELRGGRTLRYVGIDAPERATPHYAEARSLNRQLVEGREVVIFAPRVESRDRFRRLLAAVFVQSERSQSGSSVPVCVNTRLAAEGLALLYLKDDGAVSRTLFQPLLLAQNQALDADAGMWSSSTGLHAEKVLVTRRRFHRPECEHVLRRRGPIDTREKALRTGKSPCRTCKP